MLLEDCAELSVGPFCSSYVTVPTTSLCGHDRAAVLVGLVNGKSLRRESTASYRYTGTIAVLNNERVKVVELAETPIAGFVELEESDGSGVVDVPDTCVADGVVEAPPFVVALVVGVGLSGAGFGFICVRTLENKSASVAIWLTVPARAISCVVRSIAE